ncbi:MAG TPA: VWA domain-containing protein [Pyrinomonadaceae bacterium]|jgi:Ca-activated chloride channel family protein|nr:VWA domain-containing protein [Pyrinomonadaceae bacterium]
MPVAVTRFLFKCLSAVLIVAAGAVVVSAQKPKASPSPTPEQTPQGTERILIRRVRLPITVTDKKGQFIPGLTKEDFVILEDKVPQTIETFSDDLSLTTPLYIAVLMDTSPSTAGKLKFQQESAMNFIHTVVKPRKDRVLFATFDDSINLRQDFTDRLDLLDKAVFSVKQMGKQTALYDAVWQFCDEKMRSVSGRRVLLIVTDGDDTYSRADIRDAIDIAQRTETTIFAISTKAGFLATVPGVEAGTVADKGDRDLQTLCEETGGIAFFTGDMLSLERSFTKISKELRAQYLVTYNPTNKQYDGTFRKIDVKLADRRGDLKVRTKRGYKAIADSVLQ